MAHFITSNTSYVKYLRGKIIVNNPVNIDLCTCIKKSSLNWYPDNNGLPSIILEGVDVEWVYETEKERDGDFNSLSQNKKSNKVDTAPSEPDQEDAIKPTDTQAQAWQKLVKMYNILQKERAELSALKQEWLSLIQKLKEF